ncbi:MAG: hypothetical protein QME82_03180 [Bacillota bacterium]|nr:hypothetical protein [Bacillota bacterium]
MIGLRSLVASALASGAAFVFNRAASRGGRPGPLLAFVLGPGVEEAAKTGFALAIAAPVVVVHLGFGAVEAVYDASVRRGWTSWSGPGFAAGAVSLLSHTAFGVLTQAVLALTRQPLLAVTAAAVAHALWNVGIVALMDAGRRS